MNKYHKCKSSFDIANIGERLHQKFQVIFLKEVHKMSERMYNAKIKRKEGNYNRFFMNVHNNLKYPEKDEIIYHSKILVKPNHSNLS